MDKQRKNTVVIDIATQSSLVRRNKRSLREELEKMWKMKDEQWGCNLSLREWLQQNIETLHP